MISLQFDFDFNMPLTIVFAVADPDVLQPLPVIATFLNREPRSGHKVHAFQSQPDPEVIESDSLDGPTSHQWLKIFGFHIKHVPPIERNSRRLKPRSNDARFIDDPNRDFGVGVLQLTPQKFGSIF